MTGVSENDKAQAGDPLEVRKLRDDVLGLYRRLQAGALRPEDTTGMDGVATDDIGGFLARVAVDRAEYDKYLGVHGEYPLFRVFGADAIVLDVGAHVGYSIIGMRYAGCRARIVSVDAMAYNIAALTTLSPLVQPHEVIHSAVGASDGQITFYAPVLNGHVLQALSSTGGTLTDFFVGHVSNHVGIYPSRRRDGGHEVKLLVQNVDVARVDAILTEHGIDPVRVEAMKLDVEGHEGPAVEGAHHLFATSKPLLMVEGANRDPEVVKRMTFHGYFHCELAPSGKLVAYTDYSMGNDGFWVHPEKVEAYRALGIFEGDAPQLSPQERQRLLSEGTSRRRDLERSA
jgi:FkbM family methyltransferase